MKSLSYKQAISNRKNNTFSSWDPERFKSNGEVQVWPEPKVKFNVNAGCTVFTIGSCFARNIERHLSQHGFDIPMNRFTLPKEEWGFSAPEMFNKYTPASIYQELQWAYDISKNKRSEVAFEDVSSFCIEHQKGSGRYIDLWLRGYKPVSKQRVIERRQHIFNITKTAFESELIVITLGLIEAWYFKDNNVFIQETPSATLRRISDKFYFTKLTYIECLNYIKDSIELFDPTKKILITTSPVPLNVTFTGEDVVVANSYSKALLRCVCGDLESAFPNVEYFPSYETATLSDSRFVWESDQRHVKESFVNKIAGKIIGSYTDLDSSEELLSVKLFFVTNVEDNNIQQALNFLSQLPIPEEELDVNVIDAGIKLGIVNDNLDLSLRYCKRMVEIRPGRSLRRMLEVYFKLELLEDAYDVVMDILPQRTDLPRIPLVAAEFFLKNSKYKYGIELINYAKGQWPGNIKLQADIGELELAYDLR